MVFSDLLDELKGTGKLWEDPDFKADSASVFNSRGSKNYREFQWKRPKDICADPKLFTEGASRFDVKQGALGDCWLLAVVASLSMYEQLFYRVVPNDQDFEENYIGAFRFQFWKYGSWVEIVVDDRLPTRGNKLVFMHSAETNEFWSALLEKAYAKLCGTYESLNGGSQTEAMEDFTGGLCELIKLNDKERPPGLHKQMQKFLRQCSLMGCAIESTKVEGVQANGLITGHAYSVTSVAEVKVKEGTVVELVRIRNPWGNEKEWNGKWSDKSTDWNNISAKDKEELYLKGDDGEFWMSFEDFVKNFTKLEVCHLSAGSLEVDLTGKRRWEMSTEEGSWCKNITAGGCRNFIETFAMNPQFRIEVVDPDDEDNENMGTIIVGLMQKGMRQKKLDNYVIGYVIYKLKDQDVGLLNKTFFKSNASVAKSPGFINLREICGRHKLPIGHYVIVPSTFNPNEEAEFMMRIFTEKPNNTKELDVENGLSDPAKHLSGAMDHADSSAQNLKLIELERQLEAFFKELAGPMEVINACQLRDLINGYLMKDMKNFRGFDMEVCRSMIALRDDDHTGKMEFPEFKELLRNLRLWKAAFRDFDADNNGVFDAYEFRNALNNVGLSVSNFVFKVLGNRYTDPELGVIKFEDFIMAVIRLTNAFESMRLQPQNDEGMYLFSQNEFLESFLYM